MADLVRKRKCACQPEVVSPRPARPLLRRPCSGSCPLTPSHPLSTPPHPPHCFALLWATSKPPSRPPHRPAQVRTLLVLRFAEVTAPVGPDGGKGRAGGKAGAGGQGGGKKGKRKRGDEVDQAFREAEAGGWRRGLRAGGRGRCGNPGLLARGCGPGLSLALGLAGGRWLRLVAGSALLARPWSCPGTHPRAAPAPPKPPTPTPPTPPPTPAPTQART